MYLWFFICLGAFADATTHWEPCKGQCISNYKRNELNQEILVPACQKGCDLLTVGFISTSESSSTKQEISKPKHTSTLVLQLLQDPKSKNKLHVDHVQKVTPKTSTVHQNFVSASSPSKSNKHDDENATKFKEVSHPKSDKHESSSSKTTVEPTSQPVQDHPVEANRQTTTTNGPRRENKAKNKKQKEEVVEVKQANTAKHIQKHSPNGIHEDKNEKNNKIKIEILQSQETSEGENLNMKQRLEQAKHTCRQDCLLTFTDPAEQEACVVGCNLQLTTLSLKGLDDISDEMEFQPKSLIGMFQRVFFNLAGRVGRLVRVGWSWVSSSSQSNAVVEKPQVFGSEDLNRAAQIPLFINLRPTSLQEHMQKRIESIRAEQSNAIRQLNEALFQKHQPFENSLLFNHHSANGIPRIISIFKKESITHHKDRSHHSHSGKPEASHQESKHDQFTKIDDDLNFNNLDMSELHPILSDIQRDISSQHDQFTKIEEDLNFNNLDITELHPISSDMQRDMSNQHIQHQLDLLECISRKSGLPRWFIAITIFTSAIVVLWLCFSLTAPPDDIKVVKTKPPELESLMDENDEFDDDELSCSEKKKLLSKADDVIKIRIENV